jgi:hypothetical protein
MDDEKTFIYATAFNSILKKFIKFACDKSIVLKTNRIKQRVSLLINDAPLMAIEKAGPYILKYAENIKSRDEKFFMTVKFEEDSFDEDDDMDFRKNVIALVDQIRKIYSKCSLGEKNYLNDLADDLLIAYCSFEHHNRQKENVKKE